jgi:hypothetical protein
MKSTNEIKKWLKTVLGVTAKGNTSAGKSKWQSFYVPCDRLPNPHVLQYSLPEFPPEFRKLCLRTVYPNSPSLHSQTSAGNIEKYRLAMLPHEWEHVMAVWPVLAQGPALKEEIERELSTLG